MEESFAWTPTPNPSPQGGGGSEPLASNVNDFEARTLMKASPPPCGEGQGGGRTSQKIVVGPGRPATSSRKPLWMIGPPQPLRSSEVLRNGERSDIQSRAGHNG